jgi:hypothetical protein
MARPLTVGQRARATGVAATTIRFVRADRADARPALLTLFVFALVPAVVENTGWGVWHRNIDSCSCLSCRGLAGCVNTGRKLTGSRKKLSENREEIECYM